MTQGEKSFFEIWVSKAKTNFKIKHTGIKGFIQAKDSAVNIGFTSSKTGEFEQSPNSFSQFTSEPSSKFIYDFGKNSKFKLNFPPRPIPRFLPLPMTNENSENEEKETIEEVAYKIFPNLGRSSRPDQISLSSYQLEETDFCKVSQLPFDMLVQLRADTQCSCPVYFLYRVMRKINKQNTKWLASTPECYQTKYMHMLKNESDSLINADNSLKMIENVELSPQNNQVDLKILEDMCNFDDLVKSCRETNNVFQDPNYDFTNSEPMDCANSFDYYIHDTPIFDSSDISTESDEIDKEDSKSDIVIIDQYDSEFINDNENSDISEYKDFFNDFPNSEIQSNVETKSNDSLYDLVYQKVSFMFLLITGIVGSILFSILMIFSLVNKLRGCNKDGFIEYSTETYKNDRYYDQNEHVYSTIADEEKYNNNLVTSVKNKFDNKKNKIKYSKFDNQSLDTSIAESYCNTSVGSINIKNNPLV